MLVTLIFGGNQGDRKTLIGEAITEMSSIGKIELCSSLYETAPWGFESSDSFYNQIVTYETNLLPEEVLDKCQATESCRPSFIRSFTKTLPLFSQNARTR